MNNKLAIVTGGDIRSFGGGERWAIELVKRLKNFDVTLFSFNDKKNIRLTYNDLNNIVNVKIKRYNAFLIPILKERLPITMSAIKELSSLYEYDTVYIMEPSIATITLIMLLLKLKRFKGKIILGIHDPGFLRKIPQKQTSFRRLFIKVYTYVKKEVIIKIPNIHTINHSDSLLLRSINYKGKIYEIPNFIYINKPKTISNERRKHFIVLFVGRLDTYAKGLDLLAQVIEKTLSKNKKINFHIIGSGQEGESLITKIINKYKNNLKWYGFVSDKKLEEERRRASVDIITSRFEAFPLVTLEAQAHGLPVIAFDVKGPHDIIKNDFQGKLIEPFKIEDFVEAILYYYELWKEGKLSETYKRQIIDYIFSMYSEKKIIPKLEKMFMS